MSKYTTELRYVLESLAGYEESGGFDDIEDILTNSRAKVFSFSYPIYDEGHRVDLEKKILRHYYMREIGEETYGLWKLRLQNRMVEIMPYFNKLYETESFEFDPMLDYLWNKEVTERNSATGQKTADNSENGRSTNTNTTNLTDNTKNKDKYSDTPQGALDGVESGTYLTNARIVDNERTANSQNEQAQNITNVKQYQESDSRDENNTITETVTGKIGGKSYSQLLSEYRDTILNIDLQIIEALSDLFIGLW